MAPSEEQVKAAQQMLKDNGWCLLEKVIDEEKTNDALERLWKAKEESERRGDLTSLTWLDPNSSNVRVFYLMELNAIFRELVQHLTAIRMVKSLLGGNFLISNCTANIARPGAKSIGLHSDQSLMCPGPWLEAWNINCIWCLTDMYFENGATIFIPGSYKWANKIDVPPELEAKKMLIPFTAPAGLIVCMDRRLQHTSGCNITADKDRALVFASYNIPFMRGQVNWAVGLPGDTKATLSDQIKEQLGVNGDGNLGVVTDVNDVFDAKTANAAKTEA